MFFGYPTPTNLQLKQILQELQTMAGELAQLQTDVAAQTDVVSSAVVLLKGLKAALDAAIASGDPAALQALSASLESNTKTLSDAVTANTPAA